MNEKSIDINIEKKDDSKKEQTTQSLDTTISNTTPFKDKKILLPLLKQGKPIITPSVLTTTERLIQTIKFNIIATAEDVAMVKFVLCNLSTTGLKFRLKSNQNDCVTCRPSSYGVIKPKENYEIILTWYRQPTFNSWVDVPALKMILESCLDTKNPEEEEESRSLIKFLGAVSTADPCNIEDIPTEQLLLDSRIGNPSDKTRRVKRKTSTSSMNKMKDDQEELAANIFYAFLFLIFLLIINYGLSRK
uniref:Major sperm protein n=1 Tax=Parastrongyloides trichosuri TaxID=131310 RepID=A0A0N4Z1Z5_PARTI